ncbi:hypothetical protein FQZ97_642950 [compost metagenome]
MLPPSPTPVHSPRPKAISECVSWYADQPGEQLAVDAAQEQDAHRHRRDHQERAHVGLEQQQHAHHHHRHAHRQEALGHGLHPLLLAHGVIGGIQHHRQLHQLGRLEIHHAQRDPAARAIDALADKRHQHDHQQDQRDDKELGRIAVPYLHRHLERHQPDRQPDKQRKRMPHQEMAFTVVGVARRIRQRDRGRKDHHQAEREQHDRDPQQGLVVLHHARARGLDARYRVTQAAPGIADGGADETAALDLCVTHRRIPRDRASSSTAARNTSARCT